MTKSRGNYILQVLSPKLYGLPKIHKVGTPLRPIVSKSDSITYGVIKELAYIIKPSVVQSHHHLKNAQHFVQQIHNKRMEPGEVMISYNVKALFTSVPVDPSIHIGQQKSSTVSHITTKDHHVRPKHSYPSGVLP